MLSGLKHGRKRAKDDSSHKKTRVSKAACPGRSTSMKSFPAIPMADTKDKNNDLLDTNKACEMDMAGNTKRGIASANVPGSSSSSSTKCGTESDTEDDDEKENRNVELSNQRLREHIAYQRRCDARRVHSDGPMLLSRRISYKMSQEQSTENATCYSPLLACKLNFG
jgi:hypothetical protein